MDFFKYLHTCNRTYDFYQEVKRLRIVKYQINKYERTKEHIDANHKFETRVQKYSLKGAKIVLTFLGNEKELILRCVYRERQELL